MQVRHLLPAILFAAAIATVPDLSFAEEWRQFRGQNGAGVSRDLNLPLNWSETKNLRWKTELPGPGSSSPIVAGERIFVTCYSGYGVPKSTAGSLRDLQRHLVCVDRVTGNVQWSKMVSGDLPEDENQGYLSEHGYASNTPVTDGETIYCFFGKSGVFAFDMKGNQLWQAGVGKESSNRKWGSGASLILHKDLVIVNAAEESQSIRALDKKTGKEVWKAVGTALELAYGTPVLMELKDGKQDLVIAVPGEVWGLNPDTGKIRWFAEHSLTGNVCPSIVPDGETAYLFGGFRSSGSLAIRAGGLDDVTKSHLLWTGKNSSYVATPVLCDGRLYWIDDHGQGFCISAKSGELVYRVRIEQLNSGGRPVYASPVLANGKVYVQSRWNGLFVLGASEKYELLAQNQFENDQSDFNATPAISNGDLLLRSNRYLYCVADLKN